MDVSDGSRPLPCQTKPDTTFRLSPIAGCIVAKYYWCVNIPDSTKVSTHRVKAYVKTQKRGMTIRWAVAVAVLIGFACVAAVPKPAPAAIVKAVKVKPANDIASIKPKAEAGDAAAQLVLADYLIGIRRPAEALKWYRLAAEKGSVEAKYRIGNILLFGKKGTDSDQCVIADPETGIRWAYEAATNKNVAAYKDMAAALQAGLGVTADNVEAYFWLKLCPDATSRAQKKELDKLAAKMEVREIQEAQVIAEQFKKGIWPALAARKAAAIIPGLTLSGVTQSGRNSLAIINRRTLAEGESSSFPLNSGSITIKCIKIEKDFVLVEIQGEDEPRLLSLK